jgi:hypothetical protein
MPLVSCAAYARHRGISRQAVHKAIGKKLIKPNAAGLLDVDECDKAWRANKAPEPEQLRQSRKVAARPAATPTPTPDPAPAQFRRSRQVPAPIPSAAPTPPEVVRAPRPLTALQALASPAPQSTPGEGDLAEDGLESKVMADTRRARAIADLEELKLAERRGELVPLRVVEKERFDHARTLREKLLVLPSRVVPGIRASADNHEGRKILDAELRSLLEEVANAVTAGDFREVPDDED